MALLISYTYNLSSVNFSSDNMSLKKMSKTALAQTEVVADEITAEEAARLLGGSWVDEDGRIHTIYLDDDPSTENDWWDNLWNLDYRP